MLNFFRRKSKPRYFVTIRMDGLTYFCCDLEELKRYVDLRGGSFDFPEFKLKGGIEMTVRRV